MEGDARVIEYLNRGLRHELAAINQYWLHYRLLDNWGYLALAKYWRKESIEEMQHADKLVERIIFLDGFPNMQVIDALHIGQNVKEVLDCDLAAEMTCSRSSCTTRKSTSIFSRPSSSWSPSSASSSTPSTTSASSTTTSRRVGKARYSDGGQNR